MINGKPFYDQRLLEGIGEHFCKHPHMHLDYEAGTSQYKAVMRYICNANEKQHATRTNLIANGNNAQTVYERLNAGVIKPNSNPIYFIRDVVWMSLDAETPVSWLVKASEILHGVTHYDHSNTFMLHKVILK
jgi:hypothetical protein